MFHQKNRSLDILHRLKPKLKVVDKLVATHLLDLVAYQNLKK